MRVVAVLATVVGLSIIAMLALVVMDVAVQAVDQFRQHFHARIASSTPDNPLTPILTWGGILLTAIGVAGGLLLDANGLLGNVLANLVLIGPALVLSNFVVAYVTRTRSDSRAEMQLGMLGLLLRDGINVANTYLATLGSEVRCPIPSVSTPDHGVDLRGVLASIAKAQEIVVQADKEYYESTAENRQYSLPFKRRVARCAHLTELRRRTNHRRIAGPRNPLPLGASKRRRRRKLLTSLLHRLRVRRHRVTP